MSTETFADKLINSIKEKESIICVGLDPRIGEKSRIPDFIFDDVNNDPNEAIWQFNKAIIDTTHQITPVYKPQIAFYEKYHALDALKRTIAYIRQKHSLSILDAKRNDIGSTSDAYADAVFKYFEADAVTVNSYFGIDGVLPFLKYIPQGKGIFLLLKTSNKSSGEFQDLFSVNIETASPEDMEIRLENVSLVRNYIQMTRLMRAWGDNSDLIPSEMIGGEFGYSSLGGVVGATYPAQMKAVRKEAPKNFILIPGYGAQGGTAADVVHGVNKDGLGAIVNASRSINFAYQDKTYKDQFNATQFAEAAFQSAEDMRKAINSALKESGKMF